MERRGSLDHRIVKEFEWTPWWCALFHRTLWEVEQLFGKPDYPFMQSTSSWCPKCEERRTWWSG